jgi:hypothetical protein
VSFICLVHGQEIGKHVCLFCCLCYKDLKPEDCNINDEGQKEDVCKDCAALEKKVIQWMLLNVLTAYANRRHFNPEG